MAVACSTICELRLCTGSSRKGTPSGHEKGVRNWNWPLMRMVLVSGHQRCKR